ncbi:DUF885 domain-containing protein [Neiella marina]|uniref:DUF885 domain-containing protein n=1 Tax=Neiella holothuriorum TaxID=2870530 RepID=A0ABS7ED81_9GAMM|nr:DUF885 domain-containing protein [Neiella holothuriorum]MBW8190190.1 DUF885 domain-containing protein [Neiella holothuriorum]
MRPSALFTTTAAALFLTLAGCDNSGSTANTNPSPDALINVGEECDISQLKGVLDDYFIASKQLYPMWATALGDTELNGKFADGLSDQWLAQRHTLNTQSLAQIQQLNTSCYRQGEQLIVNEFTRSRQLALVGETFPTRFLPLNQFSNPYSSLIQFASGKAAQPFATVADFENFNARAEAFTRWVDLAINRMNEGIESNVTLPRVLALRSAEQIRRTLGLPQSESPLWGALVQAVADDTWTPQERQKITALFEQSVEQYIVPGLAKLADYLETDYLAKTRASDGYWGLPNGRLWYKHYVNVFVDDTRSVEEIHQLGLSEVSRIHQQMLEIGKLVGIEGDLQAVFHAMTSDDKFYFDNGQQLVDGYNELKQHINPLLDDYFANQPAQDYEIREVEAYRAANAAGASYMMGSRDGSRPGVFYVNTHNLRAQPKWGMVTLSLHEASPGHHFQIATQLTLPVLSEYQNYQSNGAFVEGWALYAEHLGLEMGLFNDPYDHFGKLSDELLRAMRLVVDTGLHDKGWSREQAISYMINSSPMAKSDIVAEVERYMAWPGQALSYKLGEQTILALRAKAEQQLGDRFDIREFHDVVLRNGSISLPTLRLQIELWLAQKQRGSE